MVTVQEAQEEFNRYRSAPLSPRRFREAAFLKELGRFFKDLPNASSADRLFTFDEYHQLTFILQQNQEKQKLSKEDAKFLTTFRQLIFGTQPIRVMGLIQVLPEKFDKPETIWPALRDRDSEDFVKMLLILQWLPQAMLTPETINALSRWNERLDELAQGLLTLKEVGYLSISTLAIIDHPQRDISAAVAQIILFKDKNLLFNRIFLTIKRVTLESSERKAQYLRNLSIVLKFLENHSVLRNQLLTFLLDNGYDFYPVLKNIQLFQLAQSFPNLFELIKMLTFSTNQLREAHLADLNSAVFFLKKRDALTDDSVNLLRKYPVASRQLAAGWDFLKTHQLLKQPYISLMEKGYGRFAKQWAELIVDLHYFDALNPVMIQHLQHISNVERVLPKFLRLLTRNHLALLTPIVDTQKFEWAIHLLAANVSLDVLNEGGLAALMRCLDPAGLLNAENCQTFLKLYEKDPQKCILMIDMAENDCLRQVDFTAIAQGALQKDDVDERLRESEYLENKRAYAFSSSITLS